ncbi:TetR/AcrR family transcriptional regulator [Agromyces atrinae]|uniref:TetR/AcrR family transcriptional regulator n=1 Tax=Agromyces atrinae TaxID=592376 RepID=UPI001F567D89|nr:TetR/AcrR family transcriptional regulator [Agromyces atrinae]MCI2956686.1 TetR/AcrR family transcriptional regulator [Agromyces atrinae]
MPNISAPLGRRERNKQEKLERIIAAASELFAQHGVDDVTTQQIADAADIGAGTLFLYAKTKGELLLLVQNAHYAEALERGRAAASREDDVVDALMAVAREVVKCNRVQVENGRTYLREITFGDPTEQHHAAALAIVAETETTITEIIASRSAASADDSVVLARIVSSVVYHCMAAAAPTDATTDDVLDEIRRQLTVLLAR